MDKKQFEEKIEKLYTLDTHVSPDFQCDQSGGFPVSLCVNWDEGKAWLVPNYSLVKSGEDVSAYEQLCADYGIRLCYSSDQFNELLRDLGEDAIQSAELFGDEAMEQSL